MPCPLCGDICRCSLDKGSSASPRRLPEADVSPDATPPPAAQEVAGMCESKAQLSPETALSGHDNDVVPEVSPAWRREVAARLNRYQARRKPRPPRYPSLRLRFEEPDDANTGNTDSAGTPDFTGSMRPISNQALALDQFSDNADCANRVSESTSAEIHPLPTNASDSQAHDSV